MKVYQHVNIVTCDQDFHVYLNGILAVKDSQILLGFLFILNENQRAN